MVGIGCLIAFVLGLQLFIHSYAEVENVNSLPYHPALLPFTPHRAVVDWPEVIEAYVLDLMLLDTPGLRGDILLPRSFFSLFLFK